MNRILKKGLIFTGTAAILFVLLVSATLLYLAGNPSRVKDFATRYASKLTGLVVEAGHLDWGLDPIRVRVKDLHVSSQPSAAHGLDISLEQIGASMSLEGAFGRKTLVIEQIAAEGLHAEILEKPELTLPSSPSGGPSWVARAGARIFGWIFFQEIRFEKAKLTDCRAVVATGPGTLEARDIEASFVLDGGFDASLSASVRLPGRDLALDLPEILIHANIPINQKDPGLLKGGISANQGSIQGPKGLIQGISMTSELAFDPTDKSVNIEALEIRSGDVRGLIPIDISAPMDVLVNMSAAASLQEQQFREGVFHVRLNFPSTHIDLNGRMTGSWEDAFSTSLDSLECGLEPGKLVHVLPEDMKRDLKPFDIHGKILLSGTANAAFTQSGPRIATDLTMHLDNNRIRFELPPLRSDARLTGEVHLEGVWPDSAITSSIEAEDLRLAHDTFEIAPSKAALQVAGTVHRLELKGLDARLPEIRMGGTGNGLSFTDLRIQASEGIIDPLKGTLKLPLIQTSCEGVRPLKISVSIADGRKDIKVTGKDTGLVKLLSAEGKPLYGWNIQGKEDLKIHASLKKNGALEFTSTIGIEDLALENTDIEAYGEGLSTTVETQGRMEPGGDGLSCTALIHASKGELLFDNFYFNLGKTPAKIDIEGKTRNNHREIELTKFRAALKDLVSVDLSGSLLTSRESLQAEISASLPPFGLEPVFNKFIAEPFGMKKPILKKITVKGESSADVRLELDGDEAVIQGFLNLNQGRISSTEPDLSLDGIEMNLPVWHTGSNPRDSLDSVPRKGRLTIRSLKAPYLPEQPVSLDFLATPNKMHIEVPTQIRVPGGVLQVGDIALERDPENGFQAHASVRVEDLALRSLLTEIWPGSPQGSIRGRLDPLTYQDGEITSKGGFTAEVFGGRVTIRNVRISRLLASSPVVGFDAEWEGLNLEQMTMGTNFGLVTGVLKGHLEDFELAYGQPQQFDLLLETIPREGVPQRVSIEAVENISRIGGGGSPFVGMAGFFTSFFSEFPYEKIGIRAILENDVFRINGTVHDDGTEYLIKRSGISGVNVVNQEVDNRISFKDMIKRIQRVSASRSGPVIR